MLDVGRKMLLTPWMRCLIDIKCNRNCCNQGRLALIVCRIFKNNVYRVPWAGQWAWDFLNLSSEEVSKDCRMLNANVVFRCEEIIWHFKSNSTVTVIIIMSDAVVSESAGYIIVWSHLLKAVGKIISNSHYSLGPSVRARWAAPSVSILEYRVQSIEKFKSRWNGCISCRVSNSLFILWNKV